jgi:hypothetical protein
MDESPSRSKIRSTLQQATRERDRLVSRMAWWDRWQGIVLGPMILLSALVGYLTLFAMRLLYPIPDQAPFIGAALGIAGMGRAISSYFKSSRLDAARQRIEALQRQLERTR